MGRVTVTTSHAAPFIRYRLIQECGQAANAKTKRDQLSHHAAAFAYGQALEILREAETTKGEPAGVADFESVPGDYLRATKEYLKEGWYSLGFEARPEVQRQGTPEPGIDRWSRGPKLQRCEAEAERGTGTGSCGRLVDPVTGLCENPRDHL